MNAPPLPLEEAQQRLLALVAQTHVERIDTFGALGHYLAEPLLARRTQPPSAQSAMDGYAVAAGDLAGLWQVIGESAAGHPFSGTLAPGQCVRISTGAILPTGAGAVIVQEDVTRDGDSLRLTGTPPLPESKHVRPVGNDFNAGDTLLAAGTRIGPAQLALAITAGHRHLAVRRPPRIAVIDSGDELAPECDNCPPHQIPASNGAMIAAMLTALPCQASRAGPVPDTIEALLDAFEQSSHADLIVTTGGASVGDHDLIRPALERWGASLDFWRVAIKPGKPLLVALRGDQIILGLPGNPVSSHVTALLFLLPLVRAMAGAAAPLPVRRMIELGAPLPGGGARREFLRGWWDGESVTPHRMQDSSGLAALAASNVLIDRPAKAAPMPGGAKVPVFLLENG